MLHSIIIPVLNRNERLQVCLKSIHDSAKTCEITDYEILIVDGGSQEVYKSNNNERVVCCQGLEPIRCLPNESPPFNKSRCLNTGIDSTQSQNCILSFLDADAIVGERFMEAAQSATKYDRVCYRVRDSKNNSLSYEAYGNPDTNWQYNIELAEPVLPTPDLKPQGNSQFSIQKKTLGELRWNESYFGRAFEDLWFIRELYRRGLNNTTIFTEPEFSMKHVRVASTKNFCAGRWSDRNYRMYHGEQTTWVVGMYQGLLEKFSNALCGMPGASKAHCRFVERDEFAENIHQEVVPVLDKFVFLDRSRMMGNAGCQTLIIDGEIALKDSWEHVLHWIGLKPTSKDMEESRGRL